MDIQRDLFYERPTMETHRCRNGEEDVRNCKEMSLFIGREGKKKGVKAINAVKKRVKTRFLTWPTFENVFFVVQTINQKLLVQSIKYISEYTYIPDFIFQKNTIMAWTKGKLGTLCVVMVGSDFKIRIASALDSFVCPTLHRQFSWSTTPKYLYK